jgi:diguanylate cyclase (GGDEF)-like protein
MISLRTQQAHSEAEDKRRELEQQNNELREKSIRDLLTGLYNRRFFEELLGKEFSRVKRTGQPIGLLFLDIDHFKRLNDTHGHQFGDRVLSTVAQCIERASRDSDVVARFGGEEFVVLLTNATTGSPEIVAERIRSSVESLELEQNGVRAPVTISIGAASSQEPDDSPQALIGRADEMLHQSKKSGRNCVSVSPDSSTPAASISF